MVLIPRSAPLDRWFWAAAAGGLLISPHTFGYDASLLLVPILKLICDTQAATPIRWIATTAVVPFPYFMTMLPMPYSAGPAVLISLRAKNGEQEHAGQPDCDTFPCSEFPGHDRLSPDFG